MWSHLKALRFSFLLPAALLVTTIVSSAHAEDVYKAGQIVKDCSDCPEMVAVPAGTFVMGASLEETTRERVPPDLAEWERPQHEVTIAKPFLVGRTAITRKQYAQFADDTGRTDATDCVGYNTALAKQEALPGKTWRDPGFMQADDHPVVCVTFYDAQDYAAWLSKKTGHSYRLLTEAEWEYAARAGTTTARHWGDSYENGCDFANVLDLSAAKGINKTYDTTNNFTCTDPYIFTSPVASFPANAFGLYDMLGNVWQWVDGCFYTTYIGAPADGSARVDASCTTSTERLSGQGMSRGGAWYSVPGVVRAAKRYWYFPDRGQNSRGFRVARALD